MKVENKSLLLSMWQDKLSKEQVLAISKLLEKVEDERLEVLMLLHLKNPLLTFFLSFFLGGIAVDRFYLGDIGLGILKFLFNWFTFGIWYLLDLFFSYKKSKDMNFKTIYKALI